MINNIFKLFGNLGKSNKQSSNDESKKSVKKQSKKSEKELATLAGEPYVSIVKLDVDPNNINSGAFELDWNDKFVINLIRAGYKSKPDDSEDIIVDRWFKEVCRNIVLEVYEQNMADPQKREMDALNDELMTIRSRDLGNGRSEVS